MTEEANLDVSMSDLADRLRAPDGAAVRTEVERRLAALKRSAEAELRAGRTLEEFDRLRALEAGVEAAMSVLRTMASEGPLTTRTRVDRDRS